jgi:hypothetical protein
MLLLLLHAALADDPPVQLVASGNTLEVEMPSMEVRATPDGRTPWRRLVDGMAAEMAMAANGVDTVDASVVRAERQGEGVRLSWTELDDGDVRLSVARSSTSDLCTANGRPRIWNNTGRIVAYAPTPGREADVHADLGFIVVEDHPTVGALVALAPGDSVSVTTLTRQGEVLHEWVSVAREGGSVVIDRANRGERICWKGAPRS